MVAYAYHHCAAADSYSDNCSQHRVSTIYIYLILMKEQLKIKDSLLAILLMGILLYFLFGWKLALYIVFIIGILGLASKGFAALVHQYFGWLTGIIGKFNNIVLLSIIYWVVLTPLAFFMKGKTGIKLKKPAGSNFIDRNHLFSKNDMKNPW